MPLSRIAPQNYAQLLQAKTATVAGLLAPYSPPAPEIIASPVSGYRMRAEFRVWHTGDELDYVMFRPEDRKTPVAITEFPIACANIQALLPKLMDHLKSTPVLRRKLFQVEFLSTLAGDSLITLVYHRKLDDEWLGEAQALANQLGVAMVGRSRKQKMVIERDYVQELLPITGRDYHYRQYEQAFTQPNAVVNIKMIEWACRQAAELPGNLLELYCGNGNFTLPLSAHFEHVIATELSKSSVRAARENLELNDINNIDIVRLSAEEVTQAMNGVREFRRLAELPRPLAEFSLQSIFVDPPRAGLDQYTVEMAAEFPAIMYISCNPHTLADNLKSLCKTHRIERFAMFDQFPYTDHMECGVVLRRR